MRKTKLIIIGLMIYMLIGTLCCFGATKKTVAEAEIINAGDLLISKKILKNSVTKTGYNFDYIFQHVDDFVKESDYAVINMETSIGKKSMGYCGFPRFNTPEAIVKSAKNAGFDMFLNASNHSFDLGYDAHMYKVSVLKKNKVDYIGIRSNESEALHKLVEVNGIKIGMLNYTKESWVSTKDKVVLNRFKTNGVWEDVIVDKKAVPLIGSYNKRYLEAFYDDLRYQITELKNKGADIIVVYPHWGTQYEIGIAKAEDELAQKMCDMGEDVIVGGHPHVVEPVKVYTSKVSGKTTVCIHSMGNFVSSMNPTDKSIQYARYTRDGALFKFTVKKYSEGTACVSSVDVLPIYVYKNTKNKYKVIPLDPSKNWNKYDIGRYSQKMAGYYSYHRTKKLVNPGIKKYNGMPKIVKQPQSLTKNVGDTAVYKVSSVGNKLNCQWHYSKDNGATWQNVTVSGCKTNTLKIAVAEKKDGWLFRCRVKNVTGAVCSQPAKLTVIQPETEVETE